MSSSPEMTRAGFVPRPPAFTRSLRFIKPTLPDLRTVIHQYNAAYESGTITNADIVARLEAAVAERLEVRHCVAVSSCTSGLMLTLRALGLRGEVILPSFTFFATGHAARWNGLTPVFADCDPATWNIDPADVERKITGKTSAILAVHLYGNPCGVDQLERLASKYNLKLIFDAAHGFGSASRGRPVGGFGDAEVFSLSPTKLLIAGEGGLITTNDGTLAHLLRAGRNYGDLGAYNPELCGLNARMSEFNAALALAGLEMVDEKVRRRNAIAQLYTRLLAGIPGVGFQQASSADTHTFKDYSILIDPMRFGMSRDTLRQNLLRANIETKLYFYPPLHQQTLYQQYFDPASHALPETERICGNLLSLPIYESLPDESVSAIANAIVSEQSPA